MPFDHKIFNHKTLGLAGFASVAAMSIALAQSASAPHPLPADGGRVILAQSDDATPEEILKRKRREQQGGGQDGNYQIRRQQQQDQAQPGEQQPRQRRQQQDQAQPDEQQQRRQRRQQQIEEQQQAQPDEQQQPRQRRQQQDQAQPDEQQQRRQRRQQQDQAQPDEQQQRRQRRQQQIEEQQQAQPDEQQQRRQRRQQQIEEQQQAQPDEQEQRRQRRQQQIEEQQQAQPDEQEQRRQRRQQQIEEQQQARPQPGVEEPRQPQPNRQVEQPEPPPGNTPPAATAGRDRPLDEQSDEAVRNRMLDARKALGDKSIPAERRRALQEDMEASRRELQQRQSRGSREWGGEAPAAEGGAVINLPRAGRPNPVVETPRIDAGAARRADSLLAEDQPVDRLDDEALSRRLDRTRAALSQGNLPRDTEQELRRRLATDRTALRDRVSRREMDGARRDRRGPDEDFDRPIVVLPPTPQERDQILSDRRRGGDLDEVALNRRIQAYRYALEDERLDASERDGYSRYLDDDRRELRRRLADDRRMRADRYARMRDRRELDVDMDIMLEQRPNYRPRTVIWAAEVDDEMIEDQLIARPLRPLDETWTRRDMIERPEVVMARPEVRQALPSVELDTVHFGFNEDFVREEEITNIDRIGKIVEKIVAAHPNEVFMIEGHTDAVGGDDYNLSLSKRRAEAVKAALSEYYVIAPENLATVGLGEGYLKIPTPDEEPENRRVTLRRVTPLLSN